MFARMIRSLSEGLLRVRRDPRPAHDGVGHPGGSDVRPDVVDADDVRRRRRCPARWSRVSPRGARRRAGPGRARGWTCGSSRGGSAGRAGGASPSSRRSSRLWSASCRTRTRDRRSGRPSGTPRPRARSSARCRSAIELRHERPVARLGAVVHDDERDAVIGCETGQRVVVADAPDVVDEVRAGGEGSLGDGGLGRVDADRACREAPRARPR